MLARVRVTSIHIATRYDKPRAGLEAYATLPCGSPASPPHATSHHMGFRRTVLYSKLRPRPVTSPFYSLPSNLSATGRCRYRMPGFMTLLHASRI